MVQGQGGMKGRKMEWWERGTIGDEGGEGSRNETEGLPLIVPDRAKCSGFDSSIFGMMDRNKREYHLINQYFAYIIKQNLTVIQRVVYFARATVESASPTL